MSLFPLFFFVQNVISFINGAFIHLHCLVITNCSCSMSFFFISLSKLFVCILDIFKGNIRNEKKSDCVAEMECSLSCLKVLKIVEIIHVLFAFFYSFIFLFSNTQTHSFTQEQTFSLSAKSIIKNKSKMRRQNSTRRKSKYFCAFFTPMALHCGI